MEFGCHENILPTYPSFQLFCLYCSIMYSTKRMLNVYNVFFYSFWKISGFPTGLKKINVFDLKLWIMLYSWNVLYKWRMPKTLLFLPFHLSLKLVLEPNLHLIWVNCNRIFIGPTFYSLPGEIFTGSGKEHTGI